MNRRNLLKLVAGAAPLLIAGRLYAAQRNQPRLLVVFLRGAYDAANVVIPVSSDFYHQARPTLAIARPSPADPNAALPLEADWGLHPALKDTIAPLWAKGQVAFVPFAGTDDLTRSHFETQDTIELGQPLQGSRHYGSGFMSRLNGVLAGPRPISFTDQLPLTFRGGAPIPNMALKTVARPGVDDRQARLIESMYKGGELGAAVSEGFQVRDEVYRSIAAEMVAANRGAVSPKGFELSARRIGRLMQDQFSLGFVDVGGWDTHVNQGGATGYLAGRLAGGRPPRRRRRGVHGAGHGRGNLAEAQHRPGLHIHPAFQHRAGRDQGWLAPDQGAQGVDRIAAQVHQRPAALFVDPAQLAFAKGDRNLEHRLGRGQIAQLTGGDDGLGPSDDVVIAIVEGLDQRPAGDRARLGHGPGEAGGTGEGLFAQHRLARLQRPDRPFRMPQRGQGVVDQVEVVPGDEGGVVGGHMGDPVLGGIGLGPRRIPGGDAGDDHVVAFGRRLDHRAGRDLGGPEDADADGGLHGLVPFILADFRFEIRERGEATQGESHGRSIHREGREGREGVPVRASEARDSSVRYAPSFRASRPIFFATFASFAVNPYGAMALEWTSDCPSKARSKKLPPTLTA